MWLLSCSAPLLPATVVAADGAAERPGFEEVIVTGSHAPGTPVTNAVAVLTSQEIQALRKRTVVGLLQTLPGVLVESQGGPGGLTAVSIRGGESNFTLVLLDGVPINDPTNTRGGSVDFGNLSADLVERIEVVKGAQSAIYGSDALAGVINIITRAPTTGHQQLARVQWGEDDFRDLGFTASGAAGRGSQTWQYVVELHDKHSSREQRSSVRDNRGATVRLGWSDTRRHEVKASYRYLEGDRAGYPEQSGGSLLAVADDLERSDYEQHTAALHWTFSPSALWTSRLGVSRFDFEESLLSPGITPFFEVPPLGSESSFTRDYWQWSNTLQFSPALALQAGVDLRDEKGSSDGFLEFLGERSATDFSLSRRTTGAFTSLQYSPREALELQASLRFDEPEDFGSETSAALGVEYRLTSVAWVYANWGEAYKLPSFFALGHPLVGNSLLQPEQAETWDVGVRWRVTPQLNMEVTGFFNDFRDLIDFDDTAFINVNRSEVESKGVEMQALWEAGSAVTLRAQATYTDLEVIDEDSVLTGRPKWTAGATALWQMAPAVSGALDYRYFGRQWATSRHTGQAVTERLGDYHRIDATVRWQASPAWQFELMLDNVLDENYQGAVGFPGPSRAVRLGLRYTHS